MKPVLKTLLALAALSQALDAQQPKSTPLGPNQLHAPPAVKPAPGTAPLPPSQKQLRLQASRAATFQQLQSKQLLRQQRIATYLAHLTPAQKATAPAESHLVDVRNGFPLYNVHHNIDAAITSTTDRVRDPSGFFGADGTGITIGIWEVEVGSRNSHPEWNSRYTLVDPGTFSSLHAAHVIGTIAAAGTDPRAIGMAPNSNILAYASDDDATEMLAVAAASTSDFFINGAILVSNHSYGIPSGWRVSQSGNRSWRGNANAAGPSLNSVDPAFGRYDQLTADWDQLCWDTPYYLPFKSAGNDRGDTPPAAGGSFSYSYIDGTGETQSASTNYDPTVHPPADALSKAGYDTVSYKATAKNIMTVGATEDGVIQIGNFPKSRWLPAARTASFSSWGPTDDGRIKPDIVANGVHLHSTTNRFPRGQPVTMGYENLSGTSMASPTACGSAALLHEYFIRRFPGDLMRAATTKALIIHTTDDLGEPGPDYIYGWGMMNTERAADTIRLHANAPINRRLNEGTITAGTAQTIEFYWSEKDEPVRATLCWTDPAGTAVTTTDSRTPNLVNDLDIDIRGPGGELFQQYRLDPNNPTNTATTGDNDIDNVRQVLVADPQPGLYTLTVRNDGLLQDGEQDFSLIITGHNVFQPLILPVAVDADTPYEQSFEDDRLPYSRDAWTYRSTNAGRTQHTGFSLRMDDASPAGGDSATNSATLHLDLEGQQNVVLQFDWRDYLDESDAVPFASFGGFHDSDGLMFTPDGETWIRVISLPVDTENGWKTETLSLDATLDSFGLTPAAYTDHAQLRFFQHGTQSFPGDGIEYDNVRIYIASPGEFSFASATLSDVENTGDILVTAFRNNGTDGAASIDFATSSVTATAGADFTTTSGTLDFVDGENAKTIKIPIINNGTPEPTETFRLTLSNPTGGASLGQHTRLVVTLIDDDDPPETLAGPEDIYPVALYGHDALPQSIIVQNRGGGVLNYAVSESSSWITVTDPGAGKVTDTSAARISLSYQTSHLLPGRYRSSVRIIDEDGLNPVQRIDVHLLVGHPGESVSTTFASTINVPVHPSGKADHYPARLTVPTVRGRTSNITLALAELFHVNAGDLEIALQSPAEIPVSLMSDVSPGTRSSWVDLAFSGGGIPLPTTGNFYAGLPYSATNYGDPLDELPSPASDIFLNSIGDFTGTSPVGTWELYIADDQPEIDDGSLEGATLTVETAIIEDVFAERFKDTNNPFDLAFTSLVFTPDLDSPFGYTSQQLPLDEFPSKPAGIPATPSTDDYQKYNLTGPPLEFYGREISTLLIGENGTVGMETTPSSNIMADHTLIAPLKTDLDLGTGSILVDERQDRVVVTYAKLTIVATGKLVSFQLELFRDGRIRITYGDIPPITAEVGLSRGTSEIWSTAFTDLSTAPDPGLEIVAEEVSDGVDFGVAWTSQPDVLYHILRSNNLLDWKIIDTVPGAPGTATVWAITGQKKARTYYKIQRTSNTAAP